MAMITIGARNTKTLPQSAQCKCTIFVRFLRRHRFATDRLAAVHAHKPDTLIQTGRGYIAESNADRAGIRFSTPAAEKALWDAAIHKEAG
jgi:hypothetical protein